jgi:4-hydroxythreonine-4-phosphate dehydrogenase
MKTRILITIGDINGIGPEIILKTLSKPGFTDKFDLTVISPVKVLEYYYRHFRLKPPAGSFKIYSVCEGKVKIETGKITKEAGYISGFAIKTAIELCLKNEYDAVVTAPISKKALNLGGFRYDGHTEMLTDLSNAKTSVMFMTQKIINVAFASTHPPLKDVPKLLTKQLLIDKFKVSGDSLKRDFGIKKPRIAVLSLNPHAGEGGQIGNEEIKIISPAIDTFLRKSGDVKMEGPFPSDSFFGNRTFEKYDLTFSMYHDQGFIPFKMIAGLYGVNFTAGLSFVRTSPDHGTAFDIAGKNTANEKSLVAAIVTADKIHKNRIKFLRNKNQ